MERSRSDTFTEMTRCPSYENAAVVSALFTCCSLICRLLPRLCRLRRIFILRLLSMSTTAIRLFHHRWAVPVLAELRRERGSRFVTLANRIGVTRDSLRRTLSALIDDGLVERNPGYGHPLRPEYVLTP